MHKLTFGNRFFKSAENLNKKTKPKLKLSLDILAENPFHSKLQTKSLSGKLSGHYSFRLGKDYRVIFKFAYNNTIFLLKVGHRKDIYR